MWNAENYGIMELSENLRWDTLGDGHFSCAVSGFGMDILAIIHGFGQVFMVTRFAALAKDFVGLRVTPRHPVTREITCEKNIKLVHKSILWPYQRPHFSHFRKKKSNFCNPNLVTFCLCIYLTISLLARSS